MYRPTVIRILASVGLLIATRSSMLSQASSARDVLVRFCELDAKGEQLTSDGWKKVAALFEAPGAPRRKEITLIKDFGVSLPSLEKGKAGFYVQYIELGLIDLSAMRFSSPLPPGIKVRAGFYVIKQPRRRSGGMPGQVEESAEWLIEGPVPEPHLTVDTAIRYVTELHENAKNSAIRKNAEKTLAVLKHFR